MKNITTMNEYLRVTENIFAEEDDIKYPELRSYYQELKTACLEINQQQNENLLEALKKLLALDSQIQILREHLKWARMSSHEIPDEEMLIEQIKKDSRSYYRELVGLKASSEIPIGMIYLSECD